MEKSIEIIWKEGFLKDDALVAPKLNNLYNQKSHHLIDKMIRMFRINLITILIVAGIIFLISIPLGAVIPGAILSILLIGLVGIGKKQWDKLEEIDKSISSYHYLKQFEAWRKQVIGIFTRIYQFLYPMILLVFSLGMCYSSPGKMAIQKVLEQFPDLQMALGIPVAWWIFTLVLCVLLALFAERLYKFDLKLVYGPVFKRLEEIIEDMEELRG